LQGTIEVFYKSHKANNFHIMSILKDIDICSYIKNPPYFATAVVDHARSIYPNLVHNCPFRVGEKFYINYTYNDATCDKMRTQQKPSFNMGLHFLPDGDYKIVLTMFDDLDSAKVIYYAKANTGDQRRV
jgi:hypothetical protein